MAKKTKRNKRCKCGKKRKSGSCHGRSRKLTQNRTGSIDGLRLAKDLMLSLPVEMHEIEAILDSVCLLQKEATGEVMNDLLREYAGPLNIYSLPHPSPRCPFRLFRQFYRPSTRPNLKLDYVPGDAVHHRFHLNDFIKYHDQHVEAAQYPGDAESGQIANNVLYSYDNLDIATPLYADSVEYYLGGVSLIKRGRVTHVLALWGRELSGEGGQRAHAIAGHEWTRTDNTVPHMAGHNTWRTVVLLKLAQPQDPTTNGSIQDCTILQSCKDLELVSRCDPDNVEAWELISTTLAFLTLPSFFSSSPDLQKQAPRVRESDATVEDVTPGGALERSHGSPRNSDQSDTQPRESSPEDSNSKGGL